jgi:hypothetical protein
MAKKEEQTMTDNEMRAFERECWSEIRANVMKLIGQCAHKNCVQCSNLKVDLDVIGDMVRYMTEPDEPEKGTTM